MEVVPSTMTAILDLLRDVKVALDTCYKLVYQENLSKIHFKWQQNMNYVLSYGAQFILSLYEYRHGNEGKEFSKYVMQSVMATRYLLERLLTWTNWR